MRNRWRLWFSGILIGAAVTTGSVAGELDSITEFRELISGQANTLNVPHGVLSSKSSLPYFAFELPARKHSYQLEIISYVKDGSLFLPTTIFLNTDKAVIYAVNASGAIGQEGLASRLASRKEIRVPSGAQYLIVTTTEDQLDRNLRLLQHQSVPVILPASGGSNTTVSVPIGSNEYFFGASLEPDLEVLIPPPGQSKLRQSLDGWYLGLGSDFKEEFIANNPGGDNYGAGSGASILLGKSIQTSISDVSLITRVAAGVRYQGGEGNSQGLIAQGLLLKPFNSIALGAGIHLDSGGSVTDVNGFKRVLKPVVIPRIFVEWIGGRKLSLGGTLLGKSRFEDESTGESFAGPKFGLYANWGF